jgi:hypothetical protein
MSEIIFLVWQHYNLKLIFPKYQERDQSESEV